MAYKNDPATAQEDDSFLLRVTTERIVKMERGYGTPENLEEYVARILFDYPDLEAVTVHSRQEGPIKFEIVRDK